MAKAKLLLKNDVGLVLDITESPLGCTVYDLEGNEIGGGGGGGMEYISNIPITHVFPEGMTIDDFDSLEMLNYIEVSEDYFDQITEGRFGATLGLFEDTLTLISQNGYALCRTPVGDSTNLQPFQATITGNDVESVFGGNYKIKGNSPLTFTWTNQA